MKYVALYMILSLAVLSSCESPKKPTNTPPRNTALADKNSPNSNMRTQANRNTPDSLVPAQTETEQDRKITQAIRQAVVKNQALSTAAKNTVIATRGGVVQLRGQVNNNSERQELERIAGAVPGVRNVENKLEITRNQTNNKY